MSAEHTCSTGMPLAEGARRQLQRDSRRRRICCGRRECCASQGRKQWGTWRVRRWQVGRGHYTQVTSGSSCEVPAPGAALAADSCRPAAGLLKAAGLGQSRREAAPPQPAAASTLPPPHTPPPPPSLALAGSTRLRSSNSRSCAPCRSPSRSDPKAISTPCCCASRSEDRPCGG